MATRGAIARWNEGRKGWTGRYHHWDSYPTGLGKALWEAYHGPFKRDLQSMLVYLLDQHPAGWSSILRKTLYGPKSPKYRVIENDFGPPKGKDDERCYCHGWRSEPAWTVTHEDDAGTEWAYVFDEEQNTLSVQERILADGQHMVGLFGYGCKGQVWIQRAEFGLNGPAPDWKRLTQRPKGGAK